MRPVQTWTVKAAKRVKWSAGLADGLLDLYPEIAPNLFGGSDRSPQRLIIIDENVWTHYGTRILALLRRYGIEHDSPLILPGGEAAKTRATVDRILAAMDHHQIGRFGSMPQGWGGGVLHDAMGLAAGEFRRGVAFQFIATTLVAAIDAMFALKCAVSDIYKNRIGLYHPAESSLTDLRFFRTLTDDDIREGAAEIVKWAIAGDPHLFSLLERHGSRVVGEKFQGGDRVTHRIITRTIRGMLRELARNPYELVTARRSYLGHGISPAVEPTVRHGQAVALDILLTTMIAWRRGLVTHSQRQRIVTVISSLGLDLWHPTLEQSDRLMTGLADTALHRGGRQRIPVPKGIRLRRIAWPIGRGITYLELTEDEVRKARDDLYELVKPGPRRNGGSRPWLT